MKILSGCVLWLCVAGALAGLLPLAKNAVGKQAVAAADAHSQFRDVANVAHKAQKSVAGNQDIGRTNAAQEDAANRATSAAQTSATAFGQKAANADQYNKHQANSASKASSAAYNQHAARNNAAAKTDTVDNVWTANRNFNNGNNRNDNINYAYDKKFDLNDNQDGAYVYTDNNNVNNKDNFYDRSFAYDRNVDQFASAASAADEQANARASSAKQNNAANQAARDNFGRDAANNQQLGANQRAASNKVDSTKQSNRERGFLENQASGLNQANYLRGGNFKQQGAADKAGYGAGFQGTLSPYYNGGGYLGPGAGDYGPSLLHPSSGGLNVGKNVGGYNYGDARDAASNTQLGQQGAWGVQDNAGDTFSRDVWTNDQFQGVDDNRAAAFKDYGFANKDNHAAQSANQALNDKAQAAAAKRQNQGVSDLDENVKFAEVARKAVSDRNSNNKVYKRFFNNDNQNGNNWERLKYDRDIGDNLNGFDNQFLREKAFKDLAQADRLEQSNNGRQADAAKASNVVHDDQRQDWRRDNHGFQNAQAAADNSDAAARKGFDNRVWKYEKAQNRGDNVFQNQAARDLGANFFNNGAAQQGGAFLGAYPGSGGYNFGGLSPGFYF